MNFFKRAFKLAVTTSAYITEFVFDVLGSFWGFAVFVLAFWLVFKMVLPTIIYALVFWVNSRILCISFRRTLYAVKVWAAQNKE